MKTLSALLLAAALSCGVAQAQTTGTTGTTAGRTTDTTMNQDNNRFPWGLLGLLGLAGLYPLFDRRRTDTTTTVGRTGTNL